MLDSLLLAQAAAPEIDGTYLIALLSRVAHTTCGAVLLGGAIYLRFVLIPAADGDDEATERTLFAGRRSAWAGCVGLSATLLLLSGFYNYWLTIRTYESMPGGYHALLGTKMLLALVVIGMSSLLAGKTEAAQKVRKNGTLWANVCVAAALTIFIAAATARSFPHLPKAADEAGANQAADGLRANEAA